jgi:hypothetical protein
MGDKEADRIGAHHRNRAGDPVTAAGEEDDCHFERLDHRQRHRHQKQRRIGSKPFDPAPRQPQ